MKKINKFAATAVAVGGLLAGSAPSHATNVSSSAPDLILAFYATSSADQGFSDNLEIDLGTLSSLYTAAGGLYGTVNLSNFLSVTDLTNIFGSSWATNTDWTVFAANPATTEYLITDTATQAHAPLEDSSSNQGSVASAMSGIYTGLSGTPQTANSTHAGEILTSDPNSYTTLYGNASADWGDSDWQQGTPFKSSNSSTPFALYDAVPNENANPVAPEVGTFTLTNSGGLTFEAVPEPSTWASIFVGAASLLAFRRRRAA